MNSKSSLAMTGHTNIHTQLLSPGNETKATHFAQHFSPEDSGKCQTIVIQKFSCPAQHIVKCSIYSNVENKPNLPVEPLFRQSATFYHSSTCFSTCWDILQTAELLLGGEREPENKMWIHLCQINTLHGTNSRRCLCCLIFPGLFISCFLSITEVAGIYAHIESKISSHDMSKTLWEK